MTDEIQAGARDENLATLSDAVCRMGALMLASGTGSFRVKAAMGRVAAALGIEELEAQVGLNEIVATTRAGGHFRTQVVEVPVPVVNADRIGALMRLSLRAEAGLSAADLQHQLDRVVHRRPVYPTLVVVLAALAACAAFAFLNHGSAPECLAAGLGAAVGKLVQLALRRVRLNQLAAVALAATAAGVAYMLVGSVLHAVIPAAAPPEHTAFTSALLFLVPGFPLLTAVLDLARFDFSSGVSRLLYAALITLAASLGAWTVAAAFGVSPQPMPTAPVTGWLLVVLRCLASFVGVLGFALTFNTPLRVALAASTLGTIANVARLQAIDAGAAQLIATMAATLLVGLLAGWFGQRILAPRITLSVPAVLIMVPGVSTYRALVDMMAGDSVGALTNFLSVLGTLTALGAGLAAARMLTDPAWIATAPEWTNMPGTYAQRKLRRQQQQGLS